MEQEIDYQSEYRRVTQRMEVLRKKLEGLTPLRIELEALQKIRPMYAALAGITPAEGDSDSVEDNGQTEPEDDADGTIGLSRSVLISGLMREARCPMSVMEIKEALARRRGTDATYNAIYKVVNRQPFVKTKDGLYTLQ